MGKSELRKCRGCGKDRNKEQFSKWAQYCDDCQMPRWKRWYLKNKGIAKSRKSAWGNKNKDKVSKYAKRCYYKTKYGITEEQKADILASQGGVCWICGTSEPGANGWHMDHDHNEGNRIRGVLCLFCNSGLGYFKDRIELLERAMVYLRSFA